MVVLNRHFTKQIIQATSIQANGETYSACSLSIGIELQEGLSISAKRLSNQE